MLAGASLAVGARAQSAEFQTTITSDYPRQLSFKLETSAPGEVADVSLEYRIVGRGVSGLGKPESIPGGASVEVEVIVETNTGNSYIPPASEFEYTWNLTLTDGSSLSSEPETYVYLPPGYEWQSVENDVVRVYYHSDRESVAREYLAAGLVTYQSMARDLFGIELELLPVKVILFDDESDLEIARPGTPGVLDAAVTNCGVKVTSDIVFVIHQSCGTNDRTDTFRHEFTHIINEAAGEGPLGKLPSWLDEGTAVLGQSDAGDNYAGAVDAAIRSGRLIPFDQMGTAPNDASKVNLFYGEAWAMVRFLIDLEGPATYADLFATIKAGARFDQALSQVYGFDLAGFEDAFYAANGLSSPGATATPPPQQSLPTAVPTRPPLQTTSSTDDDGNGIDALVVGIIGASVLFALLAVFFYLWSLMLAGKRKSAAIQPLDQDDQWRPPPPPVP